MTFEMPTHCEVCGERLSPLNDVRSWDTCTPCLLAGREFAKDLGPEHEEETADVT